MMESVFIHDWHVPIQTHDVCHPRTSITNEWLITFTICHPPLYDDNLHKWLTVTFQKCIQRLMMTYHMTSPIKEPQKPMLKAHFWASKNMPCPITVLSWSPTFVWYVIRRKSKNGYQKLM